MYWNRIRPSGFGKAIDLIKICDYSMSFSGTDRISYDTLATITPDEGFVLPWTPDSQKTYQVIFSVTVSTALCDTHRVWSA